MTGKQTHTEASNWSPVIDTHAHLFRSGLPLVEHATYRPTYSFEEADYLAVLDREGVFFGVVTAPSFLGSYNDFTLDVLRHSRRLRGTAIVEPQIEAYALRDLANSGIVGIRYSLRGYPELPDFTAPEYQRLLRRVRDLDLYVHILAETERLALLIPPLNRAGVKLVIDHFGVPESRFGDSDPGFQAILAAIQNGNTWVKLSAPYRTKGINMKTVAQRLLAEAGPERLVWGSDCPWTAHEDQFTYRDTIRWFEEWIPDVAIREKIGRGGMELNKFI